MWEKFQKSQRNPKNLTKKRSKIPKFLERSWKNLEKKNSRNPKNLEKYLKNYKNLTKSFFFFRVIHKN